MSSKLKFQLEKVNISSNAIAVSEASVKGIAQKLFYDVTEGKVSAIEAIEACTFIGKVADELKKLSDDSGKITMNKLICEEIERNADNKKDYTTAKGTKFSLAEVGTSYDYTVCKDPLYNNLTAKLEALKKEVKDREAFLKTIKDFMVVSIPDPESGELLENITINAPIKTSTSSFKCTLLKG
jgi:hypothetical protein